VRGTTGHDTSGPNTDDAMTRSEEHLVAGTEQVEAGRARLRKYVVTETQRVDVPVSHEEVRLEREPITEANRDAAYSGGDITDEEHEVTLRAERPVVSTEAEPVERVRLGKEKVTGTETVESTGGCNACSGDRLEGCLRAGSSTLSAGKNPYRGHVDLGVDVPGDRCRSGQGSQHGVAGGPPQPFTHARVQACWPGQGPGAAVDGRTRFRSVPVGI
jgi:uncharacterized protein (TIGR02271 family)